MKNLLILIAFLILICSLCFSNKIKELFANMSECPYTNAHGSEPPGFGASPGNAGYTLNAYAPHVGRVNGNPPNGNPQNVFPEFKIQPM